MKKGKIVIISGPSGSGKTTLHEKLLKSKKFKGKLVKSISATTRLKRKGEKEGRDYLFLTKKQFLHRKRIGYFLESERVFDNYYGTPKKKVEALLRAGKNVLLCIDVKGAKSVAKQFPSAVKVFVKTPSMQILKNRLQKRGSETKKDLNLRLKTARRELQEAKKYDHVVVNDSLPKALGKLEALIAYEIAQ